MKSLTDLSASDVRRPQRGDEVRFASGGTYGWVVTASQDPMKVRVGSCVKWLPFAAIDARRLGAVVLRCEAGDVLHYEIPAGSA
jgi:hypothetical protein